MIDGGGFLTVLGKVASTVFGWLRKRVVRAWSSARAFRRRGRIAHDSLTAQLGREFGAFFDSHTATGSFPYFALKRWFESGRDFQLFVDVYTANASGQDARFKETAKKFIDDVRVVTPGAPISDGEVGGLVQYIFTRLSYQTGHGPSNIQTATLNHVASKVDSIAEQNSRLSTQFTAVEQLIESHSSSSTGQVKSAELIEAEAKRRLTKLITSRFLPGADPARGAHSFAEQLSESGELALAYGATKSQAYAWCARLVAKEQEVAHKYLANAKKWGDCTEIGVAELLIDAYEGNFDSSIGGLVAKKTQASLSAALLITTNIKGSKFASEWLDKAKVQYKDLDPEGKFAAISVYREQENWDKALEICASLDTSDFDRNPVLLFSAAETYLLQAVPLELRRDFFLHFPLNRVRDVLSDDEVGLEHRRSASELWNRAETTCRQLSIDGASILARDCRLWLEYVDAALSDALHENLKTKVENGQASLHEIAIALQFEHRLDLDLVEEFIEQETALSAGQSVTAAFARYSYATSLDGPAKIASYLEKHREQILLFTDATSLEIFTCQLLAQSGQIEQANVRCEALRAQGVEVSLLARLRQLIAEANGGDKIDARVAQFRGSDDLVDLRSLVGALLQEGSSPEKLAIYSGALFTRTHNQADAETYGRALYDAGEFQKLLEFTTEHSKFVAISQELAALKSTTLFRSGDLVASLNSLPEIKSYNGGATHRQLRVAISVASGNWEALNEFIGEEWSNKDTRTPKQLIYAANIAQLIESSRARDFVELAAERGTTDPKILVSCYSLATEGGWESSQQVSDWLRVAAALSESNPDGPVGQMSMDELFERIPKWQQFTNQVSDFLNEGKLTMNVAAAALNRGLLDLYLMQAFANREEADVRRRQPLYVFSGIRDPAEIDPSLKTIAMDATSLITCEMLGITQLVIDQFNQVVIPHATQGWLFEERRKLKFHQPSRFRVANEITTLLAEGRLSAFEGKTPASNRLISEVGETLAEMLSDAKESKSDPNGTAIVVTSGPIWKPASHMKTRADVSGYGDVIASCGLLVKRLASLGELQENECHRCLAYLGLQEGSFAENVDIPTGASIFLDDIAVSHFQHLNILPKLQAAGFKVYVSRGIREQSVTLVRHGVRVNEAIELVNSLRVRLREAISNGKVALDQMIEMSDEDQVSVAHPSLAITRVSKKVDVLVTDDRSLNRHGQILGPGGVAPVATTQDILRTLNNKAVITNAQHLSYTNNLRKSGAVLVSLDAAHLQQLTSSTAVEGGVMIERGDLRAIRENLLQIQMLDVLQFPAELPWFRTTLTAFVSCLMSQWTNAIDEELSVARSNWLFDQMDLRNWAKQLVVLGTAIADIHLLQIKILLKESMRLEGDSRERFQNWLDGRILNPMQREDSVAFNKLLEESKQGIGLVSSDSSE